MNLDEPTLLADDQSPRRLLGETATYRTASSWRQSCLSSLQLGLGPTGAYPAPRVLTAFAPARQEMVVEKGSADAAEPCLEFNRRTLGA